MLKKIQFSNFRNFTSAEFDLDEKYITFIGENGKGKTSILEGIYFCSTLRSFRTSKIKELKKIGTREFQIDLCFERKNGWNVNLKISDRVQRNLYIDQIAVKKSSEFINQFQTVAFLPDDPVIITGSPVSRRRFLDIYLCMTDKDYFLALQQYVTALKNRNFLLKSGHADRRLLSSYSVPLAQSGVMIVQKRMSVIQKLEHTVSSILTEIRPSLSDIAIRYRGSSDTERYEEYLQRLEKDMDKDIQHYATSTGPHLDDFDLFVSEKLLRYYGSRGQCRMVSLALKLAEFQMLSEEKKRVLVLIDDAISDLDRAAKESFLKKISSAEQVFYAFTELPPGGNFGKILEL